MKKIKILVVILIICTVALAWSYAMAAEGAESNCGSSANLGKTIANLRDNGVPSWKMRATMMNYDIGDVGEVFMDKLIALIYKHPYSDPQAVYDAMYSVCVKNWNGSKHGM